LRFSRNQQGKQRAAIIGYKNGILAYL
jgi:hypothetical protein